MATLSARAKKIAACAAAVISNSRRISRNGVRVQNELGRMERSLRDSSSRGPDGVSIAAIRPIAPVSYSRRVAPLKFGAVLPSRRVTVLGSTTQLGERVLKTRSPFSGELIQTVACTFGSVGALAGLFLISKPISTYRAADPMLSNVSGASQ
jgi:hypothetical protein